MTPDDREPRPGEGRIRRSRWWLALVITFVLGIVGTLITEWLIREFFHEEPEPRGKIEKPLRAVTVPAGSVAAGTLVDIPEHAHVWLVARHADQVWPVGRELGHEPSWERRIPTVLPRGQALSLTLMIVEDDVSSHLHSQVGRIHALPLRALGDFEALASVPRFFVGVEAAGSRLDAIFPQAGEAEPFRYENGGGLVNAELPDDPSCHRPSRATGLRLEWRMSGEQSGGWGVVWDRTASGSFDASEFGHLTLWVKGAAGGETFQIALKDTSHEERRVDSLTLGDVTANEWRELSVPLSEFAPVDLTSLENLSIGFGQPNGSGEVCIDAIEFGGTAATAPDSGSVGSEDETEGREEVESEPPEAPSAGSAEPPSHQGPITLEGEDAVGGTSIPRAHASGESGIYLEPGETLTEGFETTEAASFGVRVRYSNDNYGPLEQVRLAIDDSPVGDFEAVDTGDWDSFAETEPLGPVALPGGHHRLHIAFSGGDDYGLEIDRVRLAPVG